MVREGWWSEPEPVADAVYRIPVLIPDEGLHAVNVYALTDCDDLCLVDAGWAAENSLGELRSKLSGLGLDLADVARIYVTHVHRDHYTLALRVRAETGARIFLGAGEKPNIERLLADEESAGLDGLPVGIRSLHQHGAAELAARLAEAWTSAYEVIAWEAPDDWLAPSSSIRAGGRDLTVLPTPGHTRGHVSFVDEGRGLFFAGDHVLPHITPSLGFEPAPSADPLGTYLHSLALVRSMPNLRLLPAHGPVGIDTHRRVDELLHHHEMRLAACRTAASGSSTAHEVAAQLPWTRRNRSFADLNDLNAMLAVHETAAHLDVLVARGELATVKVDGIRTYHAVVPAGRSEG